jgi:ABC-2 type transport system ATP-binding protein
VNTSHEFAIEASGVTKTFPADYRLTSWIARRGRPAERRVVLRDVNLGVRRNEVFGLLGANGAGKTTLLKLLVTLLLPDRGTIRIDGLDSTQASLAVKRRIGFALAGERTFYNKLSARANLEFFGALADLRGRTLARRIDEVGEIVDLKDALNRPVMSFSSGMLQRLAIARALLADPPIMIFDEPTSAVDPVHALEVRELIRDMLARRLGKTVVLSTNVLEEAWSCCDRVAILSGGRIAALGSPDSLVLRFAQRRRFEIAFDATAPDLAQRLRSLPGVEEVEIRESSLGTVALVDIALLGSRFTDMLVVLSSPGNVVRNLRELDDALFDVFRAAGESIAGVAGP